MIYNRQALKKRVLLAIMFSAIVTPWVWFVIDDRSPFYWYLYYHLHIKDIWWMINFLPFLIAASASDNPHGGTSMVLFLFLAFAQWFILFFFLSRLILNISLKYVSVFVITYFVIISITGWCVSAPQRLSASAQVTRFKELRLGLEKEKAMKYFGSPDLECRKQSATFSGNTIFHEFPQRYAEAINKLTVNRWIYYHGGMNTVDEVIQRSQCLPGKWDTEVGFGQDGKILWYDRIVDTTTLEIDTDRLNNN